jgi:hypothetical protein
MALEPAPNSGNPIANDFCNRYIHALVSCAIVASLFASRMGRNRWRSRLKWLIFLRLCVPAH